MSKLKKQYSGIFIFEFDLANLIKPKANTRVKLKKQDVATFLFSVQQTFKCNYV